MTGGVVPQKRVVIVDDSRTIQALLESTLETCGGFEVVGVASDAEAAAAMVARLRPDVVTIDLCMPYIDGAALLEMLKEFPGICKIVISDHAVGNVAMVSKLRSLGAAACVGKSEIAAGPTAFLQKVKSIVASSGTPGTFVRSLPAHAKDRKTVGRDTHRASVFGFPVPADEQARLDYIKVKDLANADPERQFDLLTKYLAQLTSFPVCLITFIDKETQWIKSGFGFSDASTPRVQAFCNYTISQDDTFVVRNAANDELFARNPLVVGEPGIRTYVGHPIITAEGIHVGALCLIDTKVRAVPEGLIGRLKGMAAIAAEMINTRPLAA